MFEKLDFKDGTIAYNDFKLDFSKPLENQIFSLKEDLFQVRYSNDDHFTIDVGWYPEMDISGNFVTYVIKNYDWEKPLFKQNSKTLDQFIKNLKKAIDIAAKKLKKN